MKQLKKEFFSLTKRTQIALLISLGVFGFLGFLATRATHFVEHDPEFCLSCHIMAGPYQKWSTSPHHLVDCHNCHEQGTKAKLWQAWFYLTKHPEKVVHHPTLNHEVCAKCHLSNDPEWKQVGETAGHAIHFKKAGIDCLACHMGGVHEFLRPVDACVQCHEDKIKGPGEKMAFMHCTDCHNFLAKKKGLIPDRATCLACHSKIHVGNETFPSDAPMSDFDCGTCHKPHAKIRPDKEVCLGCHADLTPEHHGMKAEESCVTCHKPHIWKTSTTH